MRALSTGPLLYALHQGKDHHGRRAGQAQADQSQKRNGLKAREARYFCRLGFWIINQRQKSRPLLVLKLTAVQCPEEHHQADDKTGGHVCNKVWVVHLC